MKIPRTLFVASLVVLAATKHVHGLTLPVSEDTSGSSAKMLTKAAGAATTLPVSSMHVAFIRFDAGAFASDLPVANVTSARLIIYIPRVTKAGAFTLHAVTAQWTEAVSANTPQPNFDPTPLATIPLASVVAKQFIIIDVTAAVKGWLTTPASDFGFAIVGDATANVVLGAKEGPGSGYPATLQIETGGNGVGGLGTLNGADLVGGSVAAFALADGAVTGSKLALGSITNANLAPGFTFPATTTSIADGSLTAAKIASGQVVKTLNGLSDVVTLAQGANITLTPSGNTLTIAASGTISSNVSTDTTLIGDGTSSSKLGIANGAVGNAQLAPGAGGAWQVIGGDTLAVPNTNYATTGGPSVQVTVTLPAAPAVADIVRVSGVGTGGWKIVPNSGQSIVGSTTGAGELTGSQGTTGAVQYLGAVANSGGQWQPVAESQIGAGVITSAQLAGNLILSGTTTGSFSGNGAALTNLNGSNIAPASINSAQLALGSVTALNFADGSVATATIADGSVTTGKIVDNAVTGSKLASGSVTNAHLNAGFTFPATAPVDGSVTTVKLADGSVTAAKLAAGAVSTANIADYSVTGTKLTAPFDLFANGTVIKASSGSGNGLEGHSNTYAPNIAGVYGTCDYFQGFGVGVMGTTGEGGTGVYGLVTAASTSSQAIGVRGKVTTGVGVYGETSGGVNGDTFAGVVGSNFSTGGAGVYGTGGQNGVYGQSTTSTGVAATSNSGDALYASSSSSYSGYFTGSVFIGGPLQKPGGSFKIDHPLDPANKYLYHSFVESPDMKNIYDGVVALDPNGEAVVTLPEWFGALNKDFRYQLTCLGGFAPVFIAEKIAGNRFKIAGGTVGLEVSWQVTGTRQDAWANAHRIPIEEDKTGAEHGAYLHPAEFGQPEEKGVDWARHPEMRKRLKEERVAAAAPAANP